MPWDYGKKEYRKQAIADPVWFLERAISGLDNVEKLNRSLLLKHWKKLRLPENRKAFLELLLWNKEF